MFGKVTAIIRIKGFGFIHDEEGHERFFHANNVKMPTFAELLEGQRVSFTPVESAGKGNGLRAESIVAV